jgi:hypothetical protein
MTFKKADKRLLPAPGLEQRLALAIGRLVQLGRRFHAIPTGATGQHQGREPEHGSQPAGKLEERGSTGGNDLNENTRPLGLRQRSANTSF